MSSIVLIATNVCIISPLITCCVHCFCKYLCYSIDTLTLSAHLLIQVQVFKPLADNVYLLLAQAWSLQEWYVPCVNKYLFLHNLCLLMSIEATQRLEAGINFPVWIYIFYCTHAKPLNLCSHLVCS